MSVSSYRSKLSITSVLIALLGVIIILISSITNQNVKIGQQIGLTLIAIASLLMVSSLVKSRLRRIGAEQWAIGSITVWIGFTLISVILFSFALEFDLPVNRTILIVIGLIVILLGFTTEYFDLNIKLVEIWNKFTLRLEQAMKEVRARFFRSPWTILATISLLLIVISFVIDVGYGINVSILRLVLLFVFVIVLGIEFRSLITIGLDGFSRMIVIIVQGTIRRIIHFKGLIKLFFNRLKEEILNTWIFLKKAGRFIVENTYVLGFIGTIIIGFIGFNKSEKVLLAIGILMAFASIAVLIVQQPQFVINQINRVQLATYKRTLILQNILSRKTSNRCVNCEAMVGTTWDTCLNCQLEIDRCIVCKLLISENEETMTCSGCERKGHTPHIKRWIQIKPICPTCRSSWTPLISRV